MSNMLPEPANPLEVRMARLEGSYEQIDKRLSMLEVRLDHGLSEVRNEISVLRIDVHSRLERLDTKLDTRFNILTGLTVFFGLALGILQVLNATGVLSRPTTP